MLQTQPGTGWIKTDVVNSRHPNRLGNEKAFFRLNFMFCIFKEK